MSAFDVRIQGSGIVSRAMALALAPLGLKVALQARPPAPVAPAASDDIRAYALNAASVRLLESVRVWQALPEQARTAVLDMQVQGDSTGAGLSFSASQQGVPALAWIVDAAELERTLETAVRFAPTVSVPAELPDGAALTLVAEGRASATRARLGVGFRRHAYGHTALATRLVADRPHAGTARQWFRSPDVLALLPLDRPQPQHSYGLVWSLPEAECARWLAAEPAEFEAALQQATGGAAGGLRLAGDRQAWPLALGQAEAVTGPGWALLGDAAHQVHPLAGQGLNLGLGDVAALAATLAARESWRELGDPVLLRRYARQRVPAHQAMACATDGLWHLFSQSNPGLRELRNHGLTLVNQLAPVKRWLVSRALEA